MGCVILPFYLWNLIDRKSYEDFLLKGVSPLSRESRNEILRQRGAEPWFSSIWKKEIKEGDLTYFGLKKFNSKSAEFLCAPSMNKTWWVKKESKVRKATKASRKSDDDGQATRLESVHRSFQGFSSNQKNQSRFRYADSRFGLQKGLHMMEESMPGPFQTQSKRWSGKTHRGSQEVPKVLLKPEPVLMQQ